MVDAVGGAEDRDLAGFHRPLVLRPRYANAPFLEVLRNAAVSFPICWSTASAHRKEALDSFNIRHCPIPHDRRENVRYPN
jgi:hypothetical protein